MRKFPIRWFSCHQATIVLFAAVFVGLNSEIAIAASGTEGASFLDIPVGARPAALGSAYTALASDAYASVWNPAGLGFVRQTEIAGQHLSYLESVHDEYVGIAQPVGRDGSFGAGVQYLGSGDIAATDNSGASIGNFSSYFASYRAAYGRRFGDAFALGLTGQWINARIDDFSANAYAADLGAMFRPSDQWNFGATVTNIGSKLTFINTGDPLPLEGHLSAAFRPNTHWLITGEAVQSASDGASGRGGVEWSPVEMLSLRAGYKSDTVKELSAMAGMSLGIGLHVWGSELAYAWLPLGDLGTSNYFSVLVHFGQKAEQKNLAYFQSYPAASDIEEVIRLITAPEPTEVASR